MWGQRTLACYVRGTWPKRLGVIIFKMRLNGNPDLALKQGLQAMACQCYIAYIYSMWIWGVLWMRLMSCSEAVAIFRAASSGKGENKREWNGTENSSQISKWQWRREEGRERPAGAENDAKRENVKMRGKCVNDTEQFTIIASPVRGQPGSRAVWQSGSVDESGNPVARKQSWRLKVHLNLNAVNAPHSREVGNIKLSDQRKSIG